MVPMRSASMAHQRLQPAGSVPVEFVVSEFKLFLLRGADEFVI
jgi:hypothetical protein